MKELFSLTEPEDAQNWISDHGIDMTVEEVAGGSVTAALILTGKIALAVAGVAGGAVAIGAFVGVATWFLVDDYEGWGW